MNNTNEVLQQKVLDALKWEPLLNTAAIIVRASNGIVTLSGEVDSYAKLLEAKHAVQHVTGVIDVIDDIKVIFANGPETNDRHIEENALQALKWSWTVPYDKVHVSSVKGWLTLSGELKWNYQKDAARELVKHIEGVKGVINKICIKSHTQDAVEQLAIENALGRSSIVSRERITVNVNGNKVILNGLVKNYEQRAEAERLAWCARGVNSVDNELSIEY